MQKGEKGSPGELSGLIRYRNDNVIGQIRVNSSNGIYGSFTSSSGNNITELQTAASASNDTVNASESFNQSKTSFWDFADSFSGNDFSDRLQHVFNKNSIPTCRILDKNVGYRTDYFSILQDGTA